MTTETRAMTRRGGAPLLGASAAGAVAVLVLVAAAALTADRAAVVGAAVGGVLTLAVFALGIAFVSFAARLVPSASLLVALLTYALQLLVLAAAVEVIDRSGATEEALSRGWFAAGVIAVTLLWLGGQLLAATRQRILAYDLPQTAAAAEHPGGER